MDTKEEAMGAEEKKKKNENYQQTKGVRISLHAYLTSLGRNKTPTIIGYQKNVLGSIQRFLCRNLLYLNF